MGKPEAKPIPHVERGVIAIADLVEAKYNPRTISDEALAGLEASIDRFGAVQEVVVNVRDGKNVVVGGHQKLRIYRKRGITEAAAVFVDLSPKDEKALNIALNSPAIAGTYSPDLDALLGEIAEQDAQLFSDLRLGQLGSEPPAFDSSGEWQGMPEYNSEDQSSFQHVIVHFASQKDVEDFESLLGQKIGKLRSIWHPRAEIGRIADKRYATTAADKS
jgi:hypothetical protein